ncbi:MAG: DUF6134 family protein, partial [Pseudomonadota bacterium]
RRAVLAGGLACLAAPMLARPLRAASRAERRFAVDRGGSEIGTQTTAVARDGARAEVTVTVRLAITLLGVTVYRYELDSREIWEDGALVSLDGTTNDDGDRNTARLGRENGRLVSTGSWQGELPEGAATTTYWTREFLSRPVWISTQTGRPLSVRTARDGSEEIPAYDGVRECERWRVSGDLPLTLFYDERGEWMGNAFDAGGEPARFRPVAETAPLAPLWPAPA